MLYNAREEELFDMIDSPKNNREVIEVIKELGRRYPNHFELGAAFHRFIFRDNNRTNSGKITKK